MKMIRKESKIYESQAHMICCICRWILYDTDSLLIHSPGLTISEVETQCLRSGKQLQKYGSWVQSVSTSCQVGSSKTVVYQVIMVNNLYYPVYDICLLYIDVYCI